jgi:hypothetical protein
MVDDADAYPPYGLIPSHFEDNPTTMLSTVLLQHLAELTDTDLSQAQIHPTSVFGVGIHRITRLAGRIV